jgi:hypothetical protein
VIFLYTEQLSREAMLLAHVVSERDLRVASLLAMGCLQRDGYLDGQHSDATPVHVSSRDKLVARIARICSGIPRDVELGIRRIAKHRRLFFEISASFVPPG